MEKIKIIATPAGFAPEHIREQWNNIVIPLAVNPIPDDKVGLRIGNDNTGGYQVKGVDAVKALRKAGRIEAADYWEDYKSGIFIFEKLVCNLIE